jgi:hypothetical protein
VVVTSVLQTTAGKMIFGRYVDAPAAAQPAAQPAVQAPSAAAGDGEARRPPRPQTTPAGNVAGR